MKRFESVAAVEGSAHWAKCIEREKGLYSRPDDPRSEFSRDYTRILHSTAYRRLKHKTQVFFATGHDHVCTRIEHVNHVASVSHTIASTLGLNTELVVAIAAGHDLGHAPFGHEGERILQKLASKDGVGDFWHEGNSLRFVDGLETLTDPNGRHHNLSLTYAVRDGIVCHCGEVDDRVLKPRVDPIDLRSISKAGEHQPYTWEGCVVKVADKISYLGRDIEDALTLSVLSQSQICQLLRTASDALGVPFRELNTTVILHELILDLCRESSPEHGICLSQRYFDLMKAIKDFNYEHIYTNRRLNHFRQFAEVILTAIHEELKDWYHGAETLGYMGSEEPRRFCPILSGTFGEWLIKYSDVDMGRREAEGYDNDVVYHLADRNDYLHAILDFISGMTDSFALKVFGEITSFGVVVDTTKLWS